MRDYRGWTLKSNPQHVKTPYPQFESYVVVQDSVGTTGQNKSNPVSSSNGIAVRFKLGVRGLRVYAILLGV